MNKPKAIKGIGIVITSFLIIIAGIIMIYIGNVYENKYDQLYYDLQSDIRSHHEVYKNDYGTYYDYTYVNYKGETKTERITTHNLDKNKNLWTQLYDLANDKYGKNYIDGIKSKKAMDVWGIVIIIGASIWLIISIVNDSVKFEFHNESATYAANASVGFVLYILAIVLFGAGVYGAYYFFANPKEEKFEIIDLLFFLIIIVFLFLIAFIIALKASSLIHKNQDNTLGAAIVGFAVEQAEKNQRQIEAEREYAISSQSSSVPWNKRYFTDPCPYCGHYKVRYSTWDDKKM